MKRECDFTPSSERYLIGISKVKWNEFNTGEGKALHSDKLTSGQRFLNYGNLKVELKHVQQHGAEMKADIPYVTVEESQVEGATRKVNKTGNAFTGLASPAKNIVFHATWHHGIQIWVY